MRNNPDLDTRKEIFYFSGFRFLRAVSLCPFSHENTKDTKKIISCFRALNKEHDKK